MLTLSFGHWWEDSSGVWHLSLDLVGDGEFVPCLLKKRGEQISFDPDTVVSVRQIGLTKLSEQAPSCPE